MLHRVSPALKGSARTGHPYVKSSWIVVKKKLAGRLLSIDPTIYRPRLNLWYCGTGVYQGIATLSVAGVVKTTGHATVSWNDLGETTLSMALGSCDFELAPFLLEASAIAIRMQTEDGGLFTADRAFVYENHVQSNSEGLTTKIHLKAAQATFDANPPDLPTYWVIPAVNFVADLCFSTAELATHPLRIYAVPDIPEGLESHDAFIAKMVSTGKERLIPFSFGGKPAFVEKLSDYEAKVEALADKRADHHATAVVIGVIPIGAPTDLDNLFSWLPTDLLCALAVATGTYVGSGFVEFRTADNLLAQRIHISSRCPAYKKGQRFIDDPYCAVGRSAYAEWIERVIIAFPSNQQLRGVATQLVAGLQHDLVEDITDALVRALEALTKVAGLSRQNLLADLSDSISSTVQGVINSAATDIQVEATKARARGDIATCDRLTRISSRVRSAAQTDSMFGFAVTTLVAQKGLQDEAVVNAYLGAKVPPTTWAQFLSKIRGAAIHEGLIHLPTRGEVFEVHFLLRHLGDVILRLLALEIGYTGKYLPAVARWAREARALNWVSSSTTPSDFRLH